MTGEEWGVIKFQNTHGKPAGLKHKETSATRGAFSRVKHLSYPAWGWIALSSPAHLNKPRKKKNSSRGAFNLPRACRVWQYPKSIKCLLLTDGSTAKNGTFATWSGFTRGRLNPNKITEPHRQTGTHYFQHKIPYFVGVVAFSGPCFQQRRCYWMIMDHIVSVIPTLPWLKWRYY